MESDTVVLVLAVAVLAVAIVAMVTMMPRPSHRRPWFPWNPPMLGPGGTRRLLGTEGFADLQEKFVMIKNDRCPHCVAAKPAWEELLAAGPIKTSDGSAVEIVAPVNSAAEAGLTDYEVEGVPTFLLLKPGKRPIKYFGERTVAAWKAWLQKQMCAT